MSRNQCKIDQKLSELVTSRKGRVSRNFVSESEYYEYMVTSRKGRVSRNPVNTGDYFGGYSHVPQGACE